MGKVFDRWLKLTSDNLEGEALEIIQDIQRKTKVFMFSKEDQEKVEKELLTGEALRLPFPVTTIECPDICITIMESPSEKETYIVQALVSTHDREMVLGFFVSATGSVSPISVSEFRDGVFFRKLGDDGVSEISPLMVYFADFSRKAVGIINCKDRFVLESTPLKTRKSKPREVKRSFQRPEYTVIHPQIIRKTMGLDKTGVKVRGHDVRGHWRTYESDRYVNMKGKTVWIDAHWAGPSESECSGRKYVVRLDL